MHQPQNSASSEAANTAKNRDWSEIEQWEIDAIGDFLLILYKTRVISKHNDWLVSKENIRQEFVKFLKKPENKNLEKRFIELNGTSNIGTLLHRTRFLIDTQRGNQNYRISNTNLCQYRDRKLDEYDKVRKNVIGDGGNVCSDPNDTRSGISTEVHKDAEFEDDVQFLKYEGSELQMRKLNISFENPCCFVCQLNFRNEFELENHIVFHSEESNFKLSECLRKFDTSIFKVSYKPCKNSHILCFTFETRLPKVLIEKIVLVQSRSFHYLNDARVPYSIDGKDTFYINSQFFTEFLEQPIIILFRTSSEDMRLMEQHHFMHSKPFPVMHLNANSQYLSDNSKFEVIAPLPDYNPDDDLIKALRNNFPTEYLIKIRAEFYEYIAENKKFNFQNMRTVLSMLLQMEDLALRRKNYLLLQRELKLRKYGEIYSLKFKQLAWSSEIDGGQLQHLPRSGDELILIPESAESLTIKNADIFQNLLEQGLDHVLKHYDENEKTFKGSVKRVIEGRILFVSERNIPLEKSYIVIINPSRVFLRHQRRVLESLNSMSVAVMMPFLFPQNIENPSVLPSSSLVLQNKGIGSDAEQLQAVRNIIEDAKMEAPYIITGGPGTGKTAVIVESVLQLYLRRSDTKILIVAGTDSACDEIALRLCKVLCNMHDPHAIARIYEYPCKQRREKIDELLLEYSNLYDKRHFIPAVNVLHEFRILVCTIETIGYLSLGHFGKTSEEQGVFTHVFVDDAAALTEPESLVGMACTLTSHLKLILAGDPQLLDPLLYSERAKELGLNISLLERLLSRECYRVDADGNYNRAILSKLVRNYRGHPKIVDLYNRLYYDNKMISVAPTESVSLYERWHRIPNPNYPIIFQEVNSSLRSNNDSSCIMTTYNSKELEIVLRYVKDLMYNGVDGNKIAQKDIGIISPYKKQVLCIQDQLNLRGWYQIEVGLPEDFQGKEKPIIIVSFVWKSLNTLDILNNSRRLNFMISRAKSLLILVGNSKVLNQSDDMKFLIDNCRKNKSLEFEFSVFYETKLQKNKLQSTSTSTINLIDGNESDDNDDDDDDDDDTRSQCSEVGAKAANKKQRSRKRKNKGGNNKAPTENASNMTSNRNTNNRNNQEGPKNRSDNQKCDKTSKQSSQNQNQKKNNTNNKKATDTIDQFLESLPSVPIVDPKTLNAVKNMEAEIQERMRKLNIKPLNSTVSGTDNSAGTSKAMVNNQKGNKDTTVKQQLQVQQQLNHGNAATGHGHVKRLNNNQHHHGGQNRNNNHNSHVKRLNNNQQHHGGHNNQSQGTGNKKNSNSNIQQKVDQKQQQQKQQIQPQKPKVQQHIIQPLQQQQNSVALPLQSQQQQQQRQINPQSPFVPYEMLEQVPHVTYTQQLNRVTTQLQPQTPTRQVQNFDQVVQKQQQQKQQIQPQKPKVQQHIIQPLQQQQNSVALPLQSQQQQRQINPQSPFVNYQQQQVLQQVPQMTYPQQLNRVTPQLQLQTPTRQVQNFHFQETQDRQRNRRQEDKCVIA